MNTKSTWVWLVVAAMLAVSTVILQNYFHPAAIVTRPIFPGLQVRSVTSVQIIPAVPQEIRADRADGSWLLSKPISYPAQSAAIESLLAALQKLAPAKISAAELREHKNSESEFGFDNPQITIVIESGEQRRQLLVGNLTAPGDQVYLRIVGQDGAYVADAGWLKLIPRSVTDWRSTSLVDSGDNAIDSVVLTNGAKVIELHRDATNHLWHMTRPLQSRASNERITDALQRLQGASVLQFVTDDPKADLSSFGLQPADMDLQVGSATNFSAGIHVGKSTTNDAARVYAKREGWNAVLATSGDVFLPWHGPVNDFRDQHLFDLTAPVTEIEVRGSDNFTLQRQGTNGWTVAGEKFPGDEATVEQFLNNLANMRIADFVNDVASPTDLQTYGLAPAPTRQIILRSAIGDSNAVIAQLDFSVQTNGVFVHRPDEPYFIYSITPQEFIQLPEQGWEFRQRQIWDFTPGEVAQITLHQDGRTRTLIHDGVNKWSFAAGSEGIISGKDIENTITVLGNLSASGWAGRNVTEPEKFGFNTNNLQMNFVMKNGQTHSVDFGTEYPKWQTALAFVTLDGERWVFVFPPSLYQFVLGYLTVPPPPSATP